MIDEHEVAAAILGELIPELEYAVPVLLERLERGQPLVERRSPSELGFDTGMIDPKLLDLFRVLAPYVTAAVSGILVVLHERRSREEIRALVTQMQAQNVAQQKWMVEILKVKSRMGNAPVTESEIQVAIADATARLAIEHIAQEQQ